MKHLITFLIFILSFFPNIKTFSNTKPDDRLLTNRWTASWITCPNVSLTDYGVYHFRKKILLDSISSPFVINISADNRYRLFVNGRPVCWGPARGDISHWFYETVDIAPFLKKGENSLAVIVWNFNPYIPGAQTTLKTALIIQGNTAKEEVVNTNKSWKVIRDAAYSPSLDYMQDVGCSDIVHAKWYPWGWENLDYNDSSWLNAKQLGNGQPYGTGTSYDWVLCPRNIPMMEETMQRMSTVRRSDGMALPASSFLKGKSALSIPANKKVTLLIDQTFLTTAYPELIVSGGKESQIKLTYSEALFRNGNKGNRNEIDGRSITGYVDKFYPDGGNNRMFRPLWFRTYRYIQLDIETKEEPLTINDIYGIFVAYPFKENASFESDDATLKNIWNVGWRTARLCAHETYFDCPYYEQLQYVGDTRIQALISLYVDGDDRLMRKAIQMFNCSRSYEGITMSRYPCHQPQYIPPFSLYWVNMVHDYWMHRDDAVLIKECLPGIKTVLEWFADKIDSHTGMLGPIPHWNFVDWPEQWPWDNNSPTGGVPPSGMSGGSSVLTLQYAYTLKDAIDLLENFGEKDLAQKYKLVYKSLCENVWTRCWDSNRQLLSDDISRTSYSQHANIMGILSDAVPVGLQKDLFNRINNDSSLIQATFYYRFYLCRAMVKTGQSEQYTSMLNPWYKMLNIGLTTFAENPEPSRSDCHAWSASPLYDFLATVGGITPASPGFRTVNIEPAFGPLKYIKCKMPHPKGWIEVNLKKSGTNHLKGEIVLPDDVTGSFRWNNRLLDLKGGKQLIDFH
jgi:Alpha-L-rhamnosidase N-terminal domain./Bacterial alpha-L-rhamnosidase.